MNLKNLRKNLEMALVCEKREGGSVLGVPPAGGVCRVPRLAPACGRGSAMPSAEVECSAELNNRQKVSRQMT